MNVSKAPGICRNVTNINSYQLQHLSVLKLRARTNSIQASNNKSHSYTDDNGYNKGYIITTNTGFLFLLVTWIIIAMPITVVIEIEIGMMKRSDTHRSTHDHSNNNDNNRSVNDGKL